MPTAVSVIITCYNLERYIAAAIESVLSQDWGGRPEIIVVDDCSTDASAEAIKTFSQVRSVRMAENSGVLLATLAGIEAAAGDLLFFLDGDDIWEPGKLSAMVSCFAGHPAVGFVTHDLAYADAGGRTLDRPTRPSQAMATVAASERGEKIRTGILQVGDYVWLGSAFAVRRSLARIEEFIAWARELPEPANTYQDWPLAYWIAALPDVEFGYVAAKLFRYRLHGANYSGDSGSAERAVRNLARTRNTVLAMRSIAALRRLPAACGERLDGLEAYYNYRIDLNLGRRRAAWKGLFASLGQLRGHRAIRKEIIRFAAIQLVGPERFARISSRRSPASSLPVG
jgi:glycosyltransferase involved in cell wall biosynthesis